MVNTDNEEEATPRIYLVAHPGKPATDIDRRNVNDCQSDTVYWVKDLLSDCSGFGYSNPEAVRYGTGPPPRSTWDDLEVPSASKLNTLSKKKLLDFTKRACGIFLEQTFPLIEKLRDKGSESMMVRECEKELRQHGKELIKAQRDLVAAQEELLNIQRQLLEKREVEITAVQSTAQQELKSFSSVLKEECASALAPKKIQSAIVAASEDRGCNIIIHGLEESVNSSVELETQVESLLVELGETQNVKSVERMGRQSLTVRPVKVVLKSRDAQMSILSKKSRLKRTGKFDKVYISPDRTLEERNERRQLVDRLKEMVQRSPGKHYFIRGKEVVEAPGTTEN